MTATKTQMVLVSTRRFNGSVIETNRRLVSITKMGEYLVTGYPQMTFHADTMQETRKSAGMLGGAHHLEPIA
jgi:hypothetical protein